MNGRAGMVLLAVLAVIASTTLAETGATTTPVFESFLDRPQAGGEPTRVYVGLWVVDIDNIDSAEQHYTANVFVVLRWNDSRLRHGGPGPRRCDLDTIWSPPVIVTSEIGVVRRTMREIAEVHADGTVFYRQRYVGVFSQRLQLRDFPLDSHGVQFRLAAPGYTPTDIEFLAEDRWAASGGAHSAPGAGVADDISLPDFDVTGVRAWALPYVTGGGYLTAGYVLEFQARRQVSYFAWKLLLPMLLIVMMSWLVFWIDPANASTQIGVATTAMLTLIAYRFAIDQSVPKVAYLTRMDFFIIGSSILVFLALCQVILTARLNQSGRRALALKCDVLSRIFYPVLLAALMIGSFVA